MNQSSDRNGRTALRLSFEHQLAVLQDDVLRMGSYVVQMVNLSMEALLKQDLALAERVIAMDDVADNMDFQIEAQSNRLLALQQPMSRDLRVISTGLKVITDLERIGDFAVDIAKTARRIGSEPYYIPLQSLAQMGEAAEWMVRESIHAYVDHDLDLVETVLTKDDEVDSLYDLLFTELMLMMEHDPGTLRPATLLLGVVRFLERVGDHAVNVAERVYYVETGEARRVYLASTAVRA